MKGDMKMKKNKGALLAVTFILIPIILLISFIGLMRIDSFREGFEKWSGGWPFASPPTKLRDGFSENTVSSLKDEYGVTVPKDAEFVSGIKTHALRSGTYVVILFSLPVSKACDEENPTRYVFDLLALDGDVWSPCETDGLSDQDWYAEFGGELSHSAALYKDEFDDLNPEHIKGAHLSYEIRDGELLVRFAGENPHKTYS